MIDVPTGAVATGLRTLGTLAGRPHWFTGELMEAEAAAAKYRELTGIGGYYPKDPALLSWRHQGLLALQVFPCPPRAEKSIEYTLKLPTDYRDGAYHVNLPALGTGDLTAKVSARAADARDRLTADGMPLSNGSLVRLDRAREVDLALVAHAAPTLDARLAVVPFAEKRALVRYEIAAAPRVATIPSDARIVVAIDGSRSIESGAAKAAATAADAYLSHFGAAEVEVLVFNRKVKRRHGRFVSVATARADLAHLELELQNGSDVDHALLEAERLLASTPPGKARRIVLVTDGHGALATDPGTAARCGFERRSDHSPGVALGGIRNARARRRSSLGRDSAQERRAALARTGPRVDRLRIERRAQIRRAPSTKSGRARCASIT